MLLGGGVLHEVWLTLCLWGIGVLGLAAFWGLINFYKLILVLNWGVNCKIAFGYMYFNSEYVYDYANWSSYSMC